MSYIRGDSMMENAGQHWKRLSCEAGTGHANKAVSLRLFLYLFSLKFFKIVLFFIVGLSFNGSLTHCCGCFVSVVVFCLCCQFVTSWLFSLC